MPPRQAEVPFHSHASVLVVVGLLALFFWWSFTRVGPKLVAPGEVVATARQKSWIVAGLVWTFVWSYWPLHDLSERYLFLVHMLQHSVFTMVAPACFLLGAPRWMWRWVLDRPAAVRVLRVLTKPLLALLVFNALVAFTHFPGVVETSLRIEWFHFLVHLVLFSAATLMWVPIINREPELTVFQKPTKMVYLFAQSIVPTVPASFLTFKQTAMYPTYDKAPRFFSGLNAVEDQQIAAAIMKVGVGSFIWAIVGYLFFTWWTETKAGRARDNVKQTEAVRPRLAGLTIQGNRVDEQLTWAQVEAEFTRLDAAAATDPA
jgi:putative membrane protein